MTHLQVEQRTSG